MKTNNALNLKNYEKIVTEDGSITYHSKLYNEACHSTTGAATETNTHYIQGCKVDQRAQSKNSINIFEVGFGVGIGFFETLKSTKKNDCFLNFVSTEIDSELIEEVLNAGSLEFKIYNSPIKYYEVADDDFKLIVLAGNARETIKEIKSVVDYKFDAVYQDAFSPKRNAILWTTEWFKELLTISDSHCIMSTYSSSSSIRKSMLSAGWKLYSGVKFGPKRSSTRARPTGETERAIVEKIQRSPAVEITDANYKSYKMEPK